MGIPKMFNRSKKIHEQITPKNWCKGEEWYTGDWDEDNPKQKIVQACLVGWIKGVYPYKKACKVREVVYDAINENNSYGIEDWNDAGKRKFSDVKKLVKKLDI